jgi:uncharacterized membrane protein
MPRAHSRSKAEQLSDWITATAASGPVLLAHVGWFTSWILANVGVIPGVPVFDPFPFPFLTMMVSLEAIFLALFREMIFSETAWAPTSSTARRSLPTF